MRCRSRAVLAALALCLAAGGAQAAAEDVKAAIAARLREQVPQLAPGDYALGSAAIDAELRAEVSQRKGAAAPLLETGERIWKRKFADNRSLGACFPNGGRRIAAHYPQYDPRLKRVVTLEMAINQCLKVHQEPLLETADPATMGAVTAYVRSLSEGLKVAVRVPAAGERSFEQGRRLYFTRMGQRNYACASCHVQNAGKYYGDAALSPAIGQATHWPLVRDGRAVTLQAQMRECLERMGAAAFSAGSDELNDLEYFLTYLSNGLALSPNAWRRK
jgi:sulfur-oxidizing protein SoxA